MEHLSTYPGGDLVAKGIADLRAGDRTEEALLILISAPNFRRLGFDVPSVDPIESSIEIELYSLIEARLPNSAHAAYNALNRRIVSFVQCYNPDKDG